MISLTSIQFYLIFVSAVKSFQVLLCRINKSIKHQSFAYTHLNNQTVLFQTIQFSIRKKFKCQIVLFDPWIGSYQMLPLRARVDLRAMPRKEYSTYPYAPALFSLTIRLFSVISLGEFSVISLGSLTIRLFSVISLGESYPYTEKKSVYSTAPSSWAYIV